MIKNLLLTIILLLAVATGSWAQGITTASINGLVEDKDGKPLPGATVVAIHIPSGSKYGSMTRADGRYNIPAVRVGGPYSITVTFVGYEDQVKEVDNLSLGQNFTSNFKLGETAMQLSEVQITADKDPVLNSDRTGAATNVRREQFERLPSITRSFQDLSALSPQASGSFNFGGRSNLYNNFTIDGATSNNVFGLTAVPGGQTNSQPISMDAIQDMTVSVAPYDVRQGAFTGAGVNVVTRSGTNEFSGSVYGFYRNQSMVGTKVEGVKQANTNFNYKNYGFRVGGPIIKDKLFFFANFEQEKQIQPAVTYPVGAKTNGVLNQPTADGTNSATDLEGLQTFLTTTQAGKTWTFNPGTYNNFNVPTQSTKALFKLDYNLATNHKLSVRYNQLNSFRDVTPSGSGGIGSSPPGGRTNSNNYIPFSNSFYRQNNNLKSVIMELTSTFGSKFSNDFTLGYSAFRDFRQQGGGGSVPNFPLVDILGPNGNTMTSFGPDPFTPNNRLNQDIIQINDNFNIYVPNHVITIGTANEFFRFKNIFTQQINGVYQYSSIQNFEQNVLAPSTANAPTQYLLQYSAVPGVAAPGAIWNAKQLGVYGQDEYEGIKNVKIILGLRIDVPVFSTKLPQNATSDALTFVDNQKIKVGQLPKTTPLFSPRIGFNWDAKGDKTLQVRGGTGVFTGRVPFVWLSNQVTNNGLLFGSIIATGAAAQSYNFNNVPLTSNAGAAPQFSINSTTRNFKFPQVWRTNLAVDKSLPWGMVGTLEAIYTKDINAVYIHDANLNNPIRTIDGDGRPQFAQTVAANPNGDPTLGGRRVNVNVGQALVIDNSNKGYAVSLTAQLQKTFTKGFYASAAYTRTESQDINGQSASTASSVLTGYSVVGNPNTPQMSYSSNYAPHRVVASTSYRKEYAHNLASTISLIYTGNSGTRFSYIYSNDYNGDGYTNDLIYIPKNQSDILLTTSSATDTRTTQQIWTQLDNYIKQDKYLNKHRGEYAARNGAVQPWVNLLNLRFLQDFYIETGNGKRNTLQVSVEMINVLNFIDSNWGVVKVASRSSLIGVSGFENPGATTANTVTNPLLPSNSYTTSPATGRPVLTFATNSDGTPLTNSFVPLQTSTSRWQLQLGVRYIFN